MLGCLDVAAMEGSKFYRSFHHSSSEESSKESDQSSSDSAGDADPLSLHSENDSLEMPEDQRMPVSPPADATPAVCAREMSYCMAGYHHHQLALQYAACNNFSAAFREWKLAYRFKYYAALFYIGNCYNQGKGVTKNSRKVFRL